MVLPDESDQKNIKRYIVRNIINIRKRIKKSEMNSAG